MVQAEQQVEQIVELTETARHRLINIVTSSASAGIRLGVSGGGCAGLQYTMNPAESAPEGDILQQEPGLTLFIHPMAAPYLKGTRIDFSEDLMEGGFKFINPNASNTCGCGTSFGI
jgi:iron-sulfur cluster assembly protein